MGITCLFLLSVWNFAHNFAGIFFDHDIVDPLLRYVMLVQAKMIW